MRSKKIALAVLSVASSRHPGDSATVDEAKRVLAAATISSQP